MPGPRGLSGHSAAWISGKRRARKRSDDSCRQSKSAPTIGCAVERLYGRWHINEQAQSSKEAGLTVCRDAKYNVRFGSKADIAGKSPQCPLFIQKQTLANAIGMSALCQKQT